MNRRPCLLRRVLRRRRPVPPPPAEVPARFTAQALAEAVALLAAPAYGVDAPTPDPSVPALDVMTALAGIAAAVLEETFPDDKGTRYLARLGRKAAELIGAQEGGQHDPR